MTRLTSILKSILPRVSYLLAILVLAGCVTAPMTEKAASHNEAVLLAQSGIGGTGIQLNEANEKSYLNGGIGGTGSKVAQDGGIGGTGIVGALTQIADRLRIDDIEISYDEDVTVTITGKPKKIDNLLIGQIAVIHAQKTDDQITAQSISIIHAVVGPIQQINDDDRTLKVLDQTIRLHKEIPMTVFEAGQWVRVSGYHTRENTVMATRVDRIMEHLKYDVAEIHGSVTQVLADNEYLVNGTRVITDQPVQITVGTEISVQGQWRGDYLELKQARLNPIRQEMGTVSNIVVEGFWDTIRNNWKVDFDTFRISKPDIANTVDSLRKNEMVTVYGALNKAQQVIINALNIQEVTELESGYEFDIFDDLLSDSYAENIDILEDIDSSFGAAASSLTFSTESDMVPMSMELGSATYLE